MTQPPVTTFYSFKGGVGRTQAVANVGALLASKGFHVLLVDFDLEAPGLTWLVEKNVPGVVDLLLDAREHGIDAPLFAQTPDEVLDHHSALVSPPEKLGSSEGSLRIMPAGRNDASYGGRLNQLDLGGLYLQGTGRPLIEFFKQVLQEASGIDFIFVDSRTGFSDESGICTRDLADALVVVVGLNRQNREGTAAFLSNLRKSGTKPLSVVMSPVPNGEDAAVEHAAGELEDRLTHAWGAGRPVTVDARIPYHPALAISEDLRVGGTSPSLEDAYIDVLDVLIEMHQLGPRQLVRRLRELLSGKDVPRIAQGVHLLGRLHPNQLEGLALTPEMQKLYTRDAGAEIEEALFRRLPPRSWVAADIAVELSRAKHTGAGRWYERALDVDPDDAVTTTNYATFLTDISDDQDAARQMFERAVRTAPDSVHARTGYATFLAVRGDLQAEHHFEAALRQGEPDATTFGNYALFCEQVLEAPRRAQALYERAAETGPPDALALAHFAEFLQDRGDDDGRIRCLLERALDADPNHPDVRRVCANVHVQQGEIAAAMEQFEAALRLDPNNAEVCASAAQAYLLHGRQERAVHLIEQARALGDLPERLQLEVVFYEMAFGLREGARADLLDRLRRGERGPRWNLQPTIEAANKLGHESPAVLQMAADVISGGKDLSTLQDLIDRHSIATTDPN